MSQITAIVKQIIMNSNFNVSFYDQYNNLLITLETATDAQVVGTYLICGDADGNSIKFFVNEITLIQGPSFSQVYTPIPAGFYQQDQAYFNRLSEIYNYVNTNIVSVVIRYIDALKFADGTTQTTAAGGGGGSGTVTSVGFTAGTGITLGGDNPITTSGSVIITNSAPDQIVTLTEGAGIDITGTYPNFTIASTSTGGGGIPHGTASGTDTYTTTITGVTAYNDADAYLIRFTNGNTTGCTININSLGAKDLYRNNDGLLIGGDITDGAEMLCVYNSTINGFQVIGISPNSLFAYVTNAEAITITKGQPVYAFGGQGDRLKVKLAYNTGDSTSAQTVGLVLSTSIGANQKGLIIVNGQLDGLSLFNPSNGWLDGDAVYLGPTAGTLTRVKPHAPNHLVYLGFVTTASNGSAGRMYVRVQNGYEMDEIHDVQITTPTNGNMLVYDESTSLWKNSNVIQRTSTDAALRITQLGTGEAIRVEDSTNPDSSPFVVASDGKVGIGTGSPGYFLEALTSGGVDAVMMFDGGTAANANLVARADTSLKLPLIVLTDRTNSYSILTSFYIALDRASGPSWSTLFASRNDAIYVNNYLDKGHYFVTNSGGSKTIKLNISSTGSVAIGTGVTNAAASSLLELSSTTKGILIPRMTTTERNAIVSPATGLMVYDSTLNAFYFYNGSAWATMGGGGSGTVFNIDTTSPILGGPITTSGTISIQKADASKDGYISMADWNAFNNKQDALVSGTNIKTVNSETLLGSGNVVIPAGMNWMGAFPG